MPGARTRQQAHDEMCRTRMLNELMKTVDGKDRIDKDEEMRQDKRARVNMVAGDGHDRPAEAKNEDEQMEEARGDGRTERTQKSCSRKNYGASGTAEKENVQHGGSSSSTPQARPSSNTRNVKGKTDEVQWSNSTEK